MSNETTIKFKTSPSKSLLTGGKVRYEGQLIHNRSLNEAETRKLFAEFIRTHESQSNIYIDTLTAFIIDSLSQGYRLNFGAFTVGLKFRKSLPASNSPFVEGKNALEVEIKPLSDMKSATANLKPVNVTTELKNYIFSVFQPAPYKAYDEIACDGERTLLVTGNWLWVHPGVTDEGVWIEDDLGNQLLAGTVNESNHCLCNATFSGHLEPGRYWLTIQSRYAPEDGLLRAKRRIDAK